MTPPLAVTFTAGPDGDWRIERITAVAGESLPAATHLTIGKETPPQGKGYWQLRGTVSHIRYSTANELRRLNTVSPPLGRPEAQCTALIPIRKSPAWWSMAQDERRAVFEERSGHIAKSMPFLPAIARRLHHARDLGEPFDFITWFEYAPQHANAFEELVAALRASEEWRHVEREVDIRLRRVAG